MAVKHTILLIIQVFFSVLAYDQLVVPNVTLANLSTTYGDYYADRAVDGNINQDIKFCSHTGDEVGKKEAWLRIDLNRTYSIKNVKFWYRKGGTGTTRLPGYSIRVSNDSNVPSLESICYQDPGTHISFENECEMTGQYVWIYQNNTLQGPCPMLEICEIQVFGCETGKYGNFCNNTCDHCKNNEMCGVESGRCDGLGCAEINLLPPMCNECFPGFYGADCSDLCNEFCRNMTCDRTTGTCLHGCYPGYMGDQCKQTCYIGVYGEGCNKTCGNCLYNMTCQHINGTCVNGCDEGYTGNMCSTPCEDGEYGRNCMYNCSGNCLNSEVCDKKDGTCEACVIGYEGRRCDSQCRSGWYGVNCSMGCGHCSGSSACNITTGVCERGCDPGWKDTDYCDLACNNGTFGQDCRFNCTQNCTNGESCDKTDGSCTKSDGKMSGPDSSTANVVVGVLSAIVLMISVLVFALVRRRRKRQIPDKHITEKDEDLEQIDKKDNRRVESTPDLKVYYNALVASPGSITTSQLLAKIHMLENSNEENFEEEFNSIPYGEQPTIPCTVGKLPENLQRNRFKTTFPYDHSRVILQSLQNTDYINANFIKDTRGRTAYIASQGPKPNTVMEFLQMVWQENVAVIAMVTSLTEGGTIKCASYWPEKIMNKISKGKFIIQLLSENEYANFTVRHLKMINKEIKASRHIVQLQYTTWPDHGTPTPLELLVYYHYVSRAMEKHPEHILLVHCSAGVGRTGTFIALDALYRQGQKEGKIKIVDYVNTMREDRMNMIQNSEQYRFLYDVLYESFRYKGEVLSKDSFVKRVESEISSNQAVNLSSFRKEFMELNTMRPVFKEEETQFGMLNLHLNMTNTVLPADELRIILSSYVAGRGTYYNAVPLSTFTMRDCLIAAQYPVPGAAVDLIRLLVDQECSTLVSLDLLSDVPSSKEWLNMSAEETSLGPYKVKVEPGIRLSEHVHKFTMSIKAKSNENLHMVHVYEMTTWNTEDVVPSNVNVLLDVVKFVQSIENVDPEHKMTILSRDGATGCGVFCAVYNAIQQLQQDEEVDMFTIVRQLQSRRPEMISDMSEYLFSCQAIAEHIKSEPENAYSNADKDSRETKENIYANV